MNYLSFSWKKKKENKNLPGKVYINTSRRDLIKQLLAMGAISSSTLLSPSFSFANGDNANRQSSVNNITWRKDKKHEELRKALAWRSNTPARYPDVIVQASTEEEIISAIKFARDNRLQIITRSSGHNIHTLRNGGMLLDISTMGDVSVDANRMQASAQPGALMYYFYEQIAQQGLIFPVADCYTVALGGYLLGGGYSSLGYNWGAGPACYSIIAADVILADGSRVRASSTENPGLYWAVRGIGSGFFGVVTRYQLQLYRQPDVIMQSTYTYPVESLPEIISRLNALSGEKSNKAEVSVSLNKAPGQSSPLFVKLRVRALGKDETQVKTLLSVYRQNDLEGVAISKNEYERVSYGDLMYNPDRSERNLSDNIWTDDAYSLSAIVEHCKKIPSTGNFFATLFHSRQTSALRNDACYSARGTHFMSSHFLWKDAKDDEVNKQWYDELYAILKPHATSYYVNQMESKNQSERIKDCFNSENWQRIAELRQKYDPEKRFHGYIEGV